MAGKEKKEQAIHGRLHVELFGARHVQEASEGRVQLAAFDQTFGRHSPSYAQTTDVLIVYVV